MLQQPTVILLINACPVDQQELLLDKESLLIHTHFQAPEQRQKAVVITHGDVTVRDVNETLRNYRPGIIHFSGHGIASKPTGNEDLEDPLYEPQPDIKAGIYFKDPDTGESQLVDLAYLESLVHYIVDHHNIPLKMFVFNACHSQEQAQLVANLGISYVIGSTTAILDKAAINFSYGLYQILGELETFELTDKSIKDAFVDARLMAIGVGGHRDDFVLYINGELVDI